MTGTTQRLGTPVVAHIIKKLFHKTNKMGGKRGVCQLWLLQNGGHTPNIDLWWLAGYSGEASLLYTIFISDTF